jgi:hypothetical protein
MAFGDKDIQRGHKGSDVIELLCQSLKCLSNTTLMLVMPVLSNPMMKSLLIVSHIETTNIHWQTFKSYFNRYFRIESAS